MRVVCLCGWTCITVSNARITLHRFLSFCHTKIIDEHLDFIFKNTLFYIYIIFSVIYTFFLHFLPHMASNASFLVTWQLCFPQPRLEQLGTCYLYWGWQTRSCALPVANHPSVHPESRYEAWSQPVTGYHLVKAGAREVFFIFFISNFNIECIFNLFYFLEGWRWFWITAYETEPVRVYRSTTSVSLFVRGIIVF